MSNQDGIDLRWILTVLRRWWLLIVSCTILAIVAADIIIIARIPPSYESSATLMIVAAQGTKAVDYSTLMTGQQLALTYSQMVKGQSILDDVIAKLGLNETSDDLSRRISAVPIQNTQLIRLTVNDKSPEQAALIANTIADVLSSHVQTLGAQSYKASLADMQSKITSMSALIDKTQADIHTQSAIQNTEQAELDQLQSNLSKSEVDIKTLQDSYQSLQLSIAQLVENIKVVEPAVVSKKPTYTRYTAIVTLLIRQLNGSGQGDYNTIMASERLAQTYSQMLVGRSVLKAAIDKLGLPETPEDLTNYVSAEPVTDTQLIQLTVEDLDSSRAENLANTIAEIFINQVQELQVQPYSDRLNELKTQIDTLSAQINTTQEQIKTHSAAKAQAETDLANLESLLAGYRTDSRALQDNYEQLQQTAIQSADVVAVTEPAQAPDQPSQQLLLYLLLALIVGLLLGLGLAFSLEYINATIHSVEDINREFGLLTLGTIGPLNRDDNALEIATQPRSLAAEDFRKLVTSLRFAFASSSLHTLLVTSPNGREGKSTIVANLAVALRQAEFNVIVVDADLHHPCQHRKFGVNQSQGLAESFLQGSIDGNLQHSEAGGVTILTSGNPPPNPVEVVGSPRMRALLDQISQQADLLLIDCPPVLPVADSLSLAAIVDGVLFVVRSGKTRTQAAREAVDSLRQVGAKLVGVVINAVPQHSGKYGYYHYQLNHGNSRSAWWKRFNVQVPKFLKKERAG
jgi:capsular exopolysaccharide synthesis family protein